MIRLKSLSDNDFLYVSLAYRQASIAAVFGVSCPSDGCRIGPLELGLNSKDEYVCDMSGKLLFFVEARTDPGDL